MISFKSAYSQLADSVVGLGIGIPPNFQVLGTGFVVASDGTIATNEHVAKCLLIQRDGETVIRDDAHAMFFVRSPGEESNPNVRAVLLNPVTGIHIMQPRPQNPLPAGQSVPPGMMFNTHPDIATIRIKRSGPPGLQKLVPISKVSRQPLRIGDPIAILRVSTRPSILWKYTGRSHHSAYAITPDGLCCRSRAF